MPLNGGLDVATFTVWKFEDPGAAGGAAAILAQAEADGLVRVLDHAVLSWPAGAAQPTTTHGTRGSGSRVGWGAFWGLLLGSVVATPLFGAAAGATVGAVTHDSLDDVGITKEQIDTLRWQVREGSSALFAVTEDANLDRLAERFRGIDRVLIDTNLTDPERARLLERFGTPSGDG
jgi:uncharacterized membrane protein